MGRPKKIDTNPTDEELAQIERQKYLRFANDSVAIKMFSSNRPRKFSRKQIRDFLKNPFQNYLQLQQVSQYLKTTGGNYYRIIKYFSKMLTFDHILYPAMSGVKMNKNDKIVKSLDDAAIYLDKMNIKYNYKWITERILDNGEIYLYKLEDSKGIVYKEIPTNFCRISTIEDGVFGYEVNIQMFNAANIVEFPLEFQNIYEEYNKNENKDNQKKSTDANWIQVSKKGFAFNFNGVNSIHGIPPFCFIFDDIMSVDDSKDLQQDITKLDNLKLIHQKLPMNKDTGEVQIDGDDAAIYHGATKKNLPAGVAITTNPLEMQAITLSKSGNQQIDIVQQAQQLVWDNIGVSNLLFSSNKSSGEIVKKGVITDETLVYDLLYMYANYINRELRNQVNSVYKWKIKFLEVTYSNRDEKLKIAREDLAYGGQRMEFLALKGFTPLEAINMLKMERSIGIDDLMIPKLTAHTISSGESNEGGRPDATTLDEVTDNAEASIEQR
jgi:hypothetical protein